MTPIHDTDSWYLLMVTKYLPVIIKILADSHRGPMTHHHVATSHHTLTVRPHIAPRTDGQTPVTVVTMPSCGVLWKHARGCITTKRFQTREPCILDAGATPGQQAQAVSSQQESCGCRKWRFWDLLVLIMKNIRIQ